MILPATHSRISILYCSCVTGEGHPLYFFYRENKDNKFEYRGEVKCMGYELLGSEEEEEQKISFTMEYRNYPEGLPSPTPKELKNFTLIGEPDPLIVKLDITR